jgi:hypothetical protein
LLLFNAHSLTRKLIFALCGHASSFHNDIEFASWTLILDGFLVNIDFRIFVYRFKNLDFIGIRSDFASTIMAAAKKQFVEQWRPANDEEEEELVFPATPAPHLSQKFMSSKSKSFTEILSGDLTCRVINVVAPHLEKDDFECYMEVPQESDKDVCVMTWWKLSQHCTRTWL